MKFLRDPTLGVRMEQAFGGSKQEQHFGTIDILARLLPCTVGC